MKSPKVLYWVFTALFCALMILTGSRFISQPTAVNNDIFQPLGAPGWLIMPLGIAKVAGVVTILFVKSDLFKRLAYTGFTIDLFAAFGFHLAAGDPSWYAPLIAFGLMFLSYLFWVKFKKLG